MQFLSVKVVHKERAQLYIGAAARYGLGARPRERMGETRILMAIEGKKARMTPGFLELHHVIHGFFHVHLAGLLLAFCHCSLRHIHFF